MKPNFLIIGAPKAATTSLWDLLRQHPRVFMSDTKELNFFSSEKNYERGFQWYYDNFREAASEIAIGEASPHYSLTSSYPFVAERVAKVLPDIKLIYLIRHPYRLLESAWIQYLHSRRPVPNNFEAAIRDYPRLLEGVLYWRNLTQFRKYFPDKQIKVICFEDFQSDPQAVLRECYEFLKVDIEFCAQNATEPRNAASAKKTDPSWLNRLRSTILWDKLRSKSPKGLRAWVGPRLRVQGPAKPTWTNSTASWVRGELGGDPHLILEYAGKPDNYWNLDLSPLIT